MRYGRVKTKIKHSIEYLHQAEKVATHMEELQPDLRNFGHARKALECLEQNFKNLEATAAALIHPGLRESGEGSLAGNTPYTLQHPEFKPTPGSQQVLHRAVELVDDEIQKFTRGKVPSNDVNEFIVEFLQFLKWNTSAANVKTIRFRHQQKTIIDTSGNS